MIKFRFIRCITIHKMYYNDIDLHSFNINLLTRNHKVKSSGLAVYLKKPSS